MSQVKALEAALNTALDNIRELEDLIRQLRRRNEAQEIVIAQDRGIIRRLQTRMDKVRDILNGHE